MQHIQSDIRQFMEKAKQEGPRAPTMPSLETRKLRAKLILEEALEQIRALGIVANIGDSGFGDTDITPESDIRFNVDGNHEPSLTLIADGVCDQVYVSVGTAIACGIELAPVWRLVHEANMDKFREGANYRPDGKLIKPPGWTSPDRAIGLELINQGAH